MGLIPNLNERLPSKPTSYSFDPLLIQCKPTENLSSADFFIISDFPTPIEVLENQPFIGPAGAQFNRLLSAVNLPRYKCYITHACKALIPNGIHDKLWTENGYRHPAWATLQERLLAELLAFNGKIVIVMGSTALQLLLDSSKINKISKYRGSVYKTDNFNHLAMLNKIICLTLHPSSVLPQVNPINFYVILKDLKKFLLLNDDPSLLLPEPTLYIRPTLNDVLSWYEQCKSHKVVAFDIEATPKFITCFSLAFNESSSMSIPLMDNSGNYWTVEEEVQVWKGLAEILINPDIGLVCQNGMFDLMFVLRTMGIISDNFYFDTMIAQHIVYTDLPKGLDFLTSAYTYYPYYKDEGKQSHLKIIKDWPQYWMYNAKDTAYLLAIMKGLQTELEAFNPGATDAMEYSMALHKPLMEMEWNGILTNQDAIKKRKLILYRVIDKLQKALNRISGRELNTGSSKQMIDYFYNHLNLAPYMSKDKKATCDMVALSRIAKKKKPAIAPVVAKIVIKLRKLKKLTSTYFELRVDKDDHLRCGHKITGTNTGRIATAATFFGTGSNLQNQPPSFKRFLISDPDWLLCEVDLAKAEAHVVAFLCEDANMIHAFESGVDVHSFNASKIFNTPIESVTKFQRQLGKKVVHACVDNKTEVLTPLGWKNIAQVDDNLPIATYHKNKTITFDTVLKWNAYDYDNTMYYLNNPTFDQAITLNHRIVFQNGSGTIMAQEAEELCQYKELRIPICGNYSGQITIEDNIIKLIVAIQADGSYNGKQVRFHLSKQRKIERLTTILTSLQIPFNIFPYKDNTCNIVFYPPEKVTFYLVNKKFSWTLLDLSAPCLDVFLDEVPLWDGTVDRTSKIKGSTRIRIEYCSADYENCSIVSTIAHMRNKQGLIRPVKGAYIVSLNNRKLNRMKKEHRKENHYIGKVYCPTVPSGMFMIRRNGCISITGNSNYGMGPGTFSNQLAAQDIFMSMSECNLLLDAYQVRFPGLNQWHKSIAEEIYNSRILYNLFNRPKRFFGLLNDNLLRSAYSYKPQSTVAELLNRGTIKIANDPQLGPDGFNIKLNTTVHDSDVFSIHRSQWKNLLEILMIVKSHLTHEFHHKGRKFTIGMDAKIGFQWAGATASITDFTQESVSKAFKKINAKLD